MGKFMDDIYRVLAPKLDDFESGYARQGITWDWAVFNWVGGPSEARVLK